jgi:hypothetical protein
MPIKHQSNSYRNRNGKLYRSYTDISLIDKHNTIDAGKKEITRLRAEGKDVFGEYNKDGYYRIFIFESDRELKDKELRERMISFLSL